MEASLINIPVCRDETLFYMQFRRLQTTHAYERFISVVVSKVAKRAFARARPLFSRLLNIWNITGGNAFPFHKRTTLG